MKRSLACLSILIALGAAFCAQATEPVGSLYTVVISQSGQAGPGQTVRVIPGVPKHVMSLSALPFYLVKDARTPGVWVTLSRAADASPDAVTVNIRSVQITPVTLTSADKPVSVIEVPHRFAQDLKRTYTLTPEQSGIVNMDHGVQVILTRVPAGTSVSDEPSSAPAAP